MNELKPCPFCGGEAKLIQADNPSYTPHRDGWYVICKCGASLGFNGNDDEYNTYGDFPHELCAIQAWNARTPEQAIAATLGSDRIAELEAALNKAAGNWAKADARARELESATLGSDERTCEFKPFRGPISDTDEIGDRKGVCSVCSAYMHEQYNYCPNCGAKVVGE